MWSSLPDRFLFWKRKSNRICNHHAAQCPRTTLLHYNVWVVRVNLAFFIPDLNCRHGKNSFPCRELIQVSMWSKTNKPLDKSTVSPHLRLADTNWNRTPLSESIIFYKWGYKPEIIASVTHCFNCLSYTDIELITRFDVNRLMKTVYTVYPCDEGIWSCIVVILTINKPYWES